MIIIIGLIIAFVLIVLFSNRRTRSCRWRAVRSRGQDGKSLYRCTACGAEVFTSDGKVPSDCHAFSKR